MRDPYYQKILAGLQGPLDPDAFEECVSALLQDAYPSLATVHGGSDGGLDGATVDEFVVSTTAEDVARNLRDNLDSHRDSGDRRRRVVLATSRRVTPTKRRELEATVKKCGYTLINVHEQRDIAARLYRNSRWVRELLEITGRAAALSAVPRTRGPLPEIELVARDADLRWLRNTEGHRLVVGQPGSGKTALLMELVREGKALFLAGDDNATIAEAYRDSQPALILADDAHFDLQSLERLRQVREEMGACFDIIASTWPGAEDDVADALGGLSSGNIRQLELLTRAEIVQVLRGIGVTGADDDPSLRLLVDRSANKPGLAVTLGSLWLRGEGVDVVSGKALRRSLIPALKRVLEDDPTELLACFAVGGDTGLSLQAVGEFLGVGRGEINRRAKLASQSGILNVLQNREKCLAVQPEALRSPLLGEVFFPPTQPALPYRPLLERAPHRGQAIETLALAALRGVDVPRNELRELLLEGGSRQAWRAFAVLGDAEGQWVLEHFPGRIEEVASELLESIPDPAIQRLLDEPRITEGALHWRSHPLSLLKNWVQAMPDPRRYSDPAGEALERRRRLVREAKTFLQRGGDRTAGSRACSMALSPRLESTTITVTRDAMRLTRGTLPPERVPCLLELWAQVREDVADLTPESWAELSQTLQGWWRAGGRLGPQETNPYLDGARQIVSDLVELARNQPGLLRVVEEWAHRTGVPFPPPEDKEFAILFPPTAYSNPENWKREEERQIKAARELAGRWASGPPPQVSRQLARYEAEARGFASESTASWAFFQALAGAVEAPRRWLSAFFHERLPASWLGPMLERVVKEKDGRWPRTLKRFLDSEDYAWLAATLAICCEEVPKKLVDAALERLPADRIQTACLQRRVPLRTLRLLLKHGSEEVAAAAAVGEWLSEPEGQVRQEVRVDWRQALLRVGSAGKVDFTPASLTFGLKKILGKEPDLALAWLQARAEGVTDSEPIERDGVYAAAMEALPNERRQELLGQLPPGGFSERLARLSMGDSTSVRAALRVPLG